EGVEAVRGDSDTNKLTITGKVDPTKLQEKIAQETNKKVELISPKPNNKNKDSSGGGAGDKKSENKPEKKEKSDDKKTKEKEPPVTTAVLKMMLHCEGCVQKIRRVISKTKGYHSMSVDMQKDLITVTGTMDMKALAESLKDKLNRSVEIVPPKKDKESGGGGGGGGGDKGKKGKGGGGGGDGGKNEDGNRMEFTGYGYGPGFGYAPNYGLVQGYNYHTAYGNGPGGGYVMPVMGGYEVGYPEGAAYSVERLHAPQLFSDENPNACSIM
ncbi:Heavy metal-associated domain, HMA, partial [Dillenia turbinata]